MALSGARKLLQIVYDVFGDCRVTASVWALRARCRTDGRRQKYPAFSAIYDAVMGAAVGNFIDAFGAFGRNNFLVQPIKLGGLTRFF